MNLLVLSILPLAHAVDFVENCKAQFTYWLKLWDTETAPIDQVYQAVINDACLPLCQQFPNKYKNIDCAYQTFLTLQTASESRQDNDS